LLQLLIEKGLDVNRLDDHGRTLLFYAAALRSVQAVRLLLNCGCNPSLEDEDKRVPSDVAPWPEFLDLLPRKASTAVPDLSTYCAYRKVSDLTVHQSNLFLGEISNWGCNECDEDIPDGECYYHCCSCSNEDESSPRSTFEVCNKCLEKNKGHSGHKVNMRFFTGSLLSDEEWSGQRIRSFERQKPDASPEEESQDSVSTASMENDKSQEPDSHSATEGPEDVSTPPPVS